MLGLVIGETTHNLKAYSLVKFENEICSLPLPFKKLWSTI